MSNRRDGAQEPACGAPRAPARAGGDPEHPEHSEDAGGAPAAAEPGGPEGATLARRAGTVAGFTLGSRVLGYVRDAVLANVFGAGVAFDAFIAAQTIPNVLRRLVAEGTLMLAYVPLLAGEQARGGLPAMRRFAGAVVGLLLPVLLVLVAAGAFFPSVLVDLFASGFDAPRAELAARLTRVMMPFLFFISLVAVAAGTLNTVGVFGPPAAAPILLNACIIGAVLLARGRFEPPISAAAWGVALGGLAQLALQLPFLARARLLVAPRLEPGHPSIRRLARRMLPALFGVGVYQLNMVIIRQLASYLPRGQLSCYFYASRLEEFALGVFAVSISVAALPTLSEHAARGDASALFRTFRRAARATTFVTVPAMAGLWVLAEPIVGTLFRHGQFDATAAHLTADLVTILALALVPIGAVRIMVPTYYAVGDTRTPVIAATASMITTGLAGAVLGHRFEIHGLTAATVIAATVQVVLLGLWLPGKVRAAVGAGAAPRADPSVLGHAIRAVAAVVPGAVLAGWGARERTWVGGDNLENAIVLGVLGGLMVASYAGLARLLGLAEVALILAAVRRRLPARFRG